GLSLPNLRYGRQRWSRQPPYRGCGRWRKYAVELVARADVQFGEDLAGSGVAAARVPIIKVVQTTTLANELRRRGDGERIRIYLDQSTVSRLVDDPARAPLGEMLVEGVRAG